MSTDYRYKSFSEFWPFYLSEHSRPATRVLHLIGTTIGITLIIYLIAIGKWWLFFLGFIPGTALPGWRIFSLRRTSRQHLNTRSGRSWVITR